MKTKLRTIIGKYLRGAADSREEQLLEKYDELFGHEPEPHIPRQKKNKLEREIYDRISDRISGTGAAPARPLFLKYAAVAASFILLLSIGWWFRQHTGTTEEKPVAWKESIAGKGQMVKLRLADGTEVMLNAGSRLKFPASFNKKHREVQLDGEAFFNVAHRSEQPFVIRTEKLTIQVLGTSFNVHSYKDEDGSNVSVATGKVSVSLKDRPAQQLFLTPGQKAEYHSGSGSLNKGTCSVSEETGWQKGLMTFRNKPLADVLRSVERKYGVTAEADPALLQKKVYASLGNDPAGKVLAVLADIAGGRLVQNDGSSYRIER